LDKFHGYLFFPIATPLATALFSDFRTNKISLFGSISVQFRNNRWKSSSLFRITWHVYFKVFKDIFYIVFCSKNCDINYNEMNRIYKRKRKYKYHRNQFSEKKELSPVQRENSISGKFRQYCWSSRGTVSIHNSCEENCGRSSTPGYRIFSMEILANILQQVALSCWGVQLVYITENYVSDRKGCSSLLHVRCASCGWQHSFYTSKKIKNYHEVNRRIVYRMSAIILTKEQNLTRNLWLNVHTSTTQA
jgi:hypothetical protein